MPSGSIRDYVKLKDFTPGIFSGSMNALSAHAAVPAPLGAAQQTNTYRCIGRSAGGLFPLPANTSIYAVPLGTQDSNNGFYYPSMLGVLGPINFATPGPKNSGAFPDELIFGVGFISGIDPNFKQNNFVYSLLMSLQVGSGSPSAVQVYSSVTTPPSSNFLNGQSHAVTRVHPTDYTLPGNPVFVFDDSPTQALILYPDPANALAYSNKSWTPFQGQVVGHQGRIVTLRLLTLNHPTGSLNVNEQVNFNDPPNNNNIPISAQNEVFVPEAPSGYGAWGSMSVGELFLVKHMGGAVYVTGDIANPTITRLPAVQSTGGLISIGASTTAGFMYPTLSSGMYMWNGGNTAQKISQQLDDQFFIIPQDFTNTGVFVQCEQWQEWVVVSNNWLYDTVTGSWWRLDDQTQHFDGKNGQPQYGIPNLVFRYYARGTQDNIMYAVVDKITNQPFGSYAISQYDRNVGANSFSWQSHPIPVTTELMVDVRELVLTAQGSGEVWVTLTDSEGNIQPDGPDKFRINSPNQPQRLRLNTHAHGYNIVVQIQSFGNPQLRPPSGAGPLFPAPVVYELDIGWAESTMTARI